MKRAVIVQEDLLPYIQADLDVLVNDWKDEGADDVIILSHPMGINLNPSALKDQLKAIDNLEGALLMGQLPVVRMNFPGGQSFESDYYFMDLDGTWQIDAKNIVTSLDNKKPQISIGRVILAPETGWRDPNIPDELGFYQRYLKKLHNYRLFSNDTTIRIGNFFLPFPTYTINIPPVIRFDLKGLIVNNLDDPDIRRSMFEHLYSQENISSYEFVTHDEFSNILSGEGYDALWMLAHSDSGGHMLSSGTCWSPCEYYDSGFKINFLFFEACTAGAIIWEDLGDIVNPGAIKLISDTFSSNIIFAPDYGIIMIAASKPGAFGNCTQFFDKLSEGGSFGNALISWMGDQILNNWPQGGNYMMLFGDPFIRFGIYQKTQNCIIRTSLEGTKQSMYLYRLNHFRNRYLSKSWIGRICIKNIYSMSSIFGNLAKKSSAIRFITRCLATIFMIFVPRAKKRYKIENKNK